MRRNHPRRAISGHRTAAAIPLVLLFVLAACGVQAQTSSNGNSSNSDDNNNKRYFTSASFNPSMAVVIVVLISAFFLLGFFSIYIRQCGGNGIESIAAVAIGGRSRRQRGLDPAILETFPTLVYWEVKEHKIGKGALECAICLNEFEDDDTIRLLPKCDHVFHQECIDAWLATHVTCPVCRTNYSIVETSANEAATVAPEPAASPAVALTQDPPPADQVVISVNDEQRKEEMREMARIAGKARGTMSRRPRRLPRSHSTGHSMWQADGLDRYTLRLPENVRKEIIAAGILQRSRSMALIIGGEGSSRRSLRGIGEDITRRGRSMRLGRSDRWRNFSVRSLSLRIPAWGNWRRGEDGSVKAGSLKSNTAGGGSKNNSNSDVEESSTAALNRV